MATFIQSTIMLPLIAQAFGNTHVYDHWEGAIPPREQMSVAGVARVAEAAASVEEMFHSLRDIWLHETATSSSKSRIMGHASYVSIIEMGPQVLPLIFEELAHKPDFWFRALEQITKVNPVPPNSSFSQAVSSWLDWGREHHHVRERRGEKS